MSAPSPPAYAELQVTTAFSFLEGASHAEELALTAAAQGHRALAVTDRNTLAGVVRAHLAARAHGLKLVVGCRLDLTDAPSLLAFPTDRAAYGRLSRLLTLGKRRAPKGACHLARADALAHADGMLLALLPPDDGDLVGELRLWRGELGDRLFLAASHRHRGDDAKRLARLAQAAGAARVPLVATNDVLYHSPARRPLADVLSCIRQHVTIDSAGWRLAANAERHLKPPAEMARLFAAHPGAIARTIEIAEACRFALDELKYEYPHEVGEDGRPAQEVLAELTRAGAARRYPEGVPDKVEKALAHELELIGRLGYAPYFLTVHDIVRYARERAILCQGRGSAANSAVCYCLGITAVDPARSDLLFERFISAARGEPPDIDVDFEHERREEVIQYIYAKYGRERAGLAATVIRFRTRAAIREVGRVMGLSADVVGRLAGSVWGQGWGKSRTPIGPERAREHGLDPDDPRLARTLELAGELIGFPRHLSQHVGGFVITRGPLSELCPIANAAMAERTTIEWDKDDIDALGILKVDILALGMLSCIAKALVLIRRHGGPALSLATIPAEDALVYEMLCRADSLGVFQVESRAQMAMLPRLKPRCFYDLVIEVAIVRPGPIQGDMVHPYLRRRAGIEPVDYPSPELRRVLEKTLGVPLFQEQAMRLAMVAAGFSAEEADRLRRAMASFRKTGLVHTFREAFVAGMAKNGYAGDFAQRCFRQIEGFGEYGFPESHAASFALLVYVSAWLKRFHPAAFAAALLNSQPMGFYAPAQIARDAQAHGVAVHPPDVNASDWDCTLEKEDGGALALRLGLRMIHGLAEAEAERLVVNRGQGYADVPSLWRRGGLSGASLSRLARADALRSLGLDRREGLWAVKALDGAPLPLFAEVPPREAPAPLPAMAMGEHVVMDYASLSLSLKAHPMALLRDGFSGVLPASSLATARKGGLVTVAGLVLVRQRPGTANGVLFVTLEDESAIANLVILPPVFERFRKEILAARLLAATGRVEREGLVVHLRVERATDLSHRLDELRSGDGVEAFARGRNFR